MTGTASTCGKLLMEFENYKNQEWLRRRKLRLEQVRKQSHDIAKALRRKVVDEEKLKNEIYNKVKEAEFRNWKAERLAHLEEQLRCALEEFGEGYRLAAGEPDPNEIIQKRNKINKSVAQKRGKIAYQEELKMKKMEEERKKFPIQRKIMTRKVENLRSALVRSVPVKNQLSDKWDVPTKECPASNEKALSSSKINKPSGDKTTNNPFIKMAPSKPKRKKPQRNCGSRRKSCACKNKATTLEHDVGKDIETIWINLNDIQNCSSSASVAQSKSVRSTSRSGKSKTSEGMVEFYDFPSRYFCRSYKEFPHLVERIEHSEEPDAVELAKLDEEKEKEEVKKRQDVGAITQERGLEALRREKITREYQNMISKLDELSKKEKVLKSQQRSLPSVVHMTDERLSKRARIRQKLMDSKFESIYYPATADMPPQSKLHRTTPESGDYVDLDEKIGTGLSFSACNLKQNSPASAGSEEPAGQIQPQKKQLLKEVEKVLREGRELRRTISRNWDSRSEFEETLKADRSVQALAFEGTKCQESQTDDLKPVMRTDDSLPVSTSTSYKSPPSEIKSSELLQIIERLGLGDYEKHDPNFKRKVKNLFGSCEKKSRSFVEDGPTLEYYIKKLLNMSRECVANLSVSSENISTPNLTDLDVRNDEMDVGEINPKGEEIVRLSKERADKLEEVIQNWKDILEKDIQEQVSDSEDEPDGEPPVREERSQYRLPSDAKEPLYPPTVNHRYNEITKKCSERICELSNMLEKVRRDKEKLLTSTSGKSSDREDTTPPMFGRERGDESIGAVVDSQSHADESTESWPDVMNELLRKRILTSPFKWSDGELCLMDKDNPTIETVIGNFRNEMNKIKTISLESLDSFTNANSIKQIREEEESECGQESSLESINRALTSLGLNWAKSILRKNEESRAMSSSSEGKSGEEENE